MSAVQRERADVVRNRRLIAAAAVEVFSRDPAASVEDVARQAGLQRSTVYRYFPARDDLVAVAYGYAIDALAQALRDAELHAGDAEVALRRAIDLCVGSVSGYYGVLVSGAHPTLDDAFWQRVDHALDPLALLVARAQGEGVVRSELPARWVVDLLLNIAYATLLRPDRHGMTPQELSRLAADSFLRGVSATALEPG